MLQTGQTDQNNGRLKLPKSALNAFWVNHRVPNSQSDKNHALFLGISKGHKVK